MFTIRKKFTFEAAHQLEKAHSKACTDCIHGHSYVVELYIKAWRRNDAGMVVDFGMLKAFIKDVNDMWDHALILPKSLVADYKPLTDSGKLKKVFIASENPTAEWMALELYYLLDAFLRGNIGGDCSVQKVRIHETDSGWAEYEEPKNENV